MLRIANLFPMVGMSRLTRDTILNGKMLPKGTYVSPQLSVVLIDDSVRTLDKKCHEVRLS